MIQDDHAWYYSHHLTTCYKNPFEFDIMFYRRAVDNIGTPPIVYKQTVKSLHLPTHWQASPLATLPLTPLHLHTPTPTNPDHIQHSLQTMNNPYGQSQDSVKRQMMSFFVPTETASHWHSEPGMHSPKGPALQASSMTSNIEVCVKIDTSLPYPLTWKYLAP